ncbi:hypothetical protein CS0771_47600 [Catellatospora sp. IY07-71]|uniref:hypothetical protein n=1 Tax=Catellatospora sp. IY07-71 TaxID=2728827 RepID=UPI001BB424E5|nr:hypothetical protein [Catellatospora sp. IY07-71]BCJ75216.1 hypothetical protein CS0771_47600 [Catellatospora sp. IY07-71]
MLSLIRRITAAHTAHVVATTTFCEGCAEPVCTTACRAEAARTRGYERAALATVRI